MDKLKKFFSSPLEVISKLLETARDNVGFLLVSVLIIALILGAAYGAEYYFAKKNNTSRSSERLKVHRMTLTALLSAIAFVLMLIDFPLWFLPGFYKIDLSELPVLIAAFTLGPVAGVTTRFSKGNRNGFYRRVCKFFDWLCVYCSGFRDLLCEKDKEKCINWHSGRHLDLCGNGLSDECLCSAPGLW